MDIEKRLRRLERANRMLFALLLIAVAGSTIGYVKAAGSPDKIVADSIVTRHLRVVSQYGKQGAEIFVGDDGSVGLDFTDTNGKQTLSLYSEPGPGGSPSICLGDQHTCRVIIGYVYRGNHPELNFQLRDKDGKPIWMPNVENPYALPGASK